VRATLSRHIPKAFILTPKTYSRRSASDDSDKPWGSRDRPGYPGT
jgi:hypothetical protein